MKYIGPPHVKPEIDYVPYGPEWEKEMMKFSKKDLIKLLKSVLNSADVQNYFTV